MKQTVNDILVHGKDQDDMCHEVAFDLGRLALNMWEIIGDEKDSCVSVPLKQWVN